MAIFGKNKGKQGDGDGVKKPDPFAKKAPNKSGDDVTNTGGKQTAEEKAAAENAAMQNWFRQQGLNEAIDMPKFLKAVRDGDEVAAGEAFMSALQSTARIVLKGADQLGDLKMRRAEDAAVSRAADTTTHRLLEERLFEELPFAKDPRRTPIARQVLKGFLDQEMSGTDAIKATKDYFADMFGDAAKSFGYKKTDSDGEGRNRTGFQNSRPKNSNDGDDDSDAATSEDDDFFAMLTGGVETRDSISEAFGGMKPAKAPVATEPSNEGE